VPRAVRTHGAIVDWSPSSGAAGGWQVQVATEPPSRLTLAGAAAEFYAVTGRAAMTRPPDFLRASAAQIPAGLPDWSSTFEVVHAVFSR
jgi:hypothetical protein